MRGDRYKEVVVLLCEKYKAMLVFGCVVVGYGPGNDKSINKKIHSGMS